MEVSVDINQPRSSSELDIASMFPTCNDYLALSRLHIRINDSCEVKATLAPLYTLLRRFPSVQHLDICGLPIVGEYAEYAFQPPPLRTLHISDFGPADTPASLQPFLQFLSRAPNWGDFEVMVVHKGRGDVISVEELAQFLPERKIRVREPGDESPEFEAQSGSPRELICLSPMCSCYDKVVTIFESYDQHQHWRRIKRQALFPSIDIEDRFLVLPNSVA